MNNFSDAADPEPLDPHAANSQTQPSPPPEPFSVADLRAAVLRPHRLVELVLGGRDRLARNLSTGRNVWWLAGLLLLLGVVSAMPYGAVAPGGGAGKIVLLFTGSLLICFPSLHVFSQFLGFRFNLGQNLTLACLMTCVAGLFTLSFSPIIWFIDFTTQPGPNSPVTPAGLSVVLLTVSLAMGIVHAARCHALRDGDQNEKRNFWVLWAAWLPLMLFITYRMARLLELTTW